MSNATQDATPDELMQRFRGRSLKSMLVFTIVAHAVLILGTSLPGIVRSMASGDESMSEEQRADVAVKEATASLREIAERHGMTTQDLSARFANPAARPAPTTPSATPDTAAVAPEEPKSAIEQELETAAEGPTVPPIPETAEEDLFE